MRIKRLIGAAAIGFVAVSLTATTIALGIYSNDVANKNRALVTSNAMLLAEKDRYAEELASETRSLDEARTERDRYAEELASETRSLNEARAERDRYAEELANETRSLDEVRAEQLALTEKYGEAQDAIVLLEVSRDALTSDLYVATDLLQDSRLTVESLESKVEEKDSQIVILSEELDIWRERTATAKGQLRALEAAVGNLANVTADIERERVELLSLEGQSAALAAEITELEDKRRILIFDKPVRTTPIACTGSMEPTLTCLDEVTLLSSFEPADIVVDTVVLFLPPGECVLDFGANVLHRSISVKEEGGHYFYQTQGDNNPTPDSCWIPFDNILSVVTAIQKDVHPENAPLRNSVNEAQAGYDDARAAYNREYTRACGFSLDVDRRCYLSGATYNRVINLYRVFESWESYYYCWLDKAEAGFDEGPPCIRSTSS